jgi:hypothetical protein
MLRWLTIVLILLLAPAAARAADAAEKNCGGLIGLRCGAMEWCDFGEGGQCGNADRLGTCRNRPDVCSMLAAPVCGCDGKTYANACMANGSGVDVMHPGAC